MNTHTVHSDHPVLTHRFSPSCSFRLSPGMTLDTLVGLLAREVWAEIRRYPVEAGAHFGWPLVIRTAIKAYLDAAVVGVRDHADGGKEYLLAGVGEGAHQVGAGIAYTLARIVFTPGGWEVPDETLSSELPWVLASVLSHCVAGESEANA